MTRKTTANRPPSPVGRGGRHCPSERTARRNRWGIFLYDAFGVVIVFAMLFAPLILRWGFSS